MQVREASLTLAGEELIEILNLVAYRDIDVADMLARQAGLDDWFRG